MQYQSSCAPKLARKCGIDHCFRCGADGRAAGRRAVYGHVITKFSGMGRLLTHGAPQARFAPELRYKKISICLNRGREKSVGNDDVSIVCARKYKMVRMT